MYEMKKVPLENKGDLEDIPVYDVVSAWWRGPYTDAGIVRRHVEFVAMAALAYLYKINHLKGPEALQEAAEYYAIDKTTQGVLKEVSDAYGEEIISISNTWPGEKLLASALFSDSAYAKVSHGNDGSDPTAGPFCRLAMELLNIDEKDSAIELCSGTSGFLIDTALHTKARMMIGIDNNQEAVIISRIRSMLLGNPLRIIESRVASEEVANLKGTKVFVHPPIVAARGDAEDDWNQLIKREGFESAASLYKSYRIPWLIVLSALRMQSDGGRTVALVPDALLRSLAKSEQTVQRQLVQTGRLEAVISLPSGIQHYTRAWYSLLVCSQNNESVRMVDAVGCCKKDRFRSLMTEEDIETVLRRMHEDSDYSRNVSYKELEKKGYDLRPSIYLEDSGTVKNSSVHLETVLTQLGRGKFIPARELDELFTQKETGFQYLMIKDMENDTIKMPLNYLSTIEPDLEKNCIQEGDLIISRSVPYKIALVPDLKGKKVLASGNLYFLRVDNRKINPVYLLGYLKSADGMRQLKNTARGGSMLLQKELRQLEIPGISMVTQDKYARKYRELTDKIQELRSQAEETEKELEEIMEQMNRSTE